MNWEALGAVAELVGAIGVVVTLIFLTAQIRQNTRAVKSTGQQSAVRSARDIDLLILSSPDLTNLWVSGRMDPDKLSETEWRRFRRLMSMFMRNYESLYHDHRNGLVEDEIFASWNRMAAQALLQPGAQRWLERYKGHLTAEFRDFVERQGAAQQATVLSTHDG